MGEQSLPNRNSNEKSTPNNNTQQENNDQNLEESMEVIEANGESDLDADDDDITPEEFQRLDNQLDALFSALDDIETKNDSIHAQLLQLLQANREIRQQLQDGDDSTEQQ